MPAPSGRPAGILARGSLSETRRPRLLAAGRFAHLQGLGSVRGGAAKSADLQILLISRREILSRRALLARRFSFLRLRDERPGPRLRSGANRARVPNTN